MRPEHPRARWSRLARDGARPAHPARPRARFDHEWQRDPHGQWHARRQRFRPRLQRQLFFSFGLAIVLAMSASAWVAAQPGSGHGFARVAAYVALGAVLWGLAGMWARRVVGPLRELSRVAGELGEGKLESRVRPARFATIEVRELGRSFNDMASRIEALLKEKNELLHAVSHELRTPLARMRVLLGILADSQSQPKLTLDMEREVLEMDALVGELLAGARIDAGAVQKLELSTVEAVNACLARTGLEQVLVEVSPAAERVVADPTLLARALIVLLDNAKKHGGSTVCVRVEREGPLVRFSVEDDGAGIEADDLPRLFAPFARGRGQVPDETRGLGLGLYLVKRIAEAHEGEAFAHNAKKRGAVVGLTVRSD